jgi:hypothetical protein
MLGGRADWYEHATGGSEVKPPRTSVEASVIHPVTLVNLLGRALLLLVTLWLMLPQARSLKTPNPHP